MVRLKLQPRRTAPLSQWPVPLLYLLLAAQSGIADFTSEPRWGQATAVVNNLLFVNGGKTDEFNEFSYTSAPTTNDLFLLDLSQGFDPSSPPWVYISGSENASSPQGPQLAWHTLSAYSSTGLLLFGGDGGPNSPIVLPGQSNSAELLDISSVGNPSWTSETEGWAGEPSRRIHHSTASVGGQIYLIGGEKDDGSSLGYSDHYVFNPNTPSFTQLPTDNGPPAIYGHTSIVLSDGRILVFGGYSTNDSQLIPFTTIWSMDTTQSTLSWSTESVSSSAVPPGRRAFASVWLEGDRILIHGGSDADLQTSFNDGWILDTTTSPMSWSNVSVLAEIGARRDHFAVQVGSQVLFGFGYGTNAGASVEIIIFDYSSNTITTSFTPQSTPSQTTLPAASGTGGSSPGNSAPGGASGSNSAGNPTGNPSGGSQPSGTSGGSPGSSSSAASGDGSKHETAKIAVAGVFGVLTVAAAVVFIVVVIVRRKNSQRRFQLLQDDAFGEPPAPAPTPWRIAGLAFIPWFGTRHRALHMEKVPIAGQAEGWTVLGLGRRHTDAEGPRRRIDMLADEDASEFAAAGAYRRAGSGSSKSWYSVGAPSDHERHASAGSGRSSLGGLISGSLGSFKNVGMSVKRVISGSSARGRARQMAEGLPSWGSYDDFEDSEGLLLFDKGEQYALSPITSEGIDTVAARNDIAARPRGGRVQTSETSNYSDPFKDADESVTVLYASAPVSDQDESTKTNRSPGTERDDPVNDARSSQSTFSHLSTVPPLSPLVTTESKSSSENASSLSLLGSSTAGHTTSSASQQATTALSKSSLTRPRTTSIIGSVGAPASPVKRSDSWWARFRRPSLRDGNYEQAKAQMGTLDLNFRDPNPPPMRLGAIRETSGGSGGTTYSPDSTQSRRDPRAERNEHIYSDSGHERSTTSLKTSRTADSLVLERLAGRVDVVQREATATSVGYSPSLAESAERSHERHGTWSSSEHEYENIQRASSPDTFDSGRDIVESAAFTYLEEARGLVQSLATITSPAPIFTEGRPVSSEQRTLSTPTPLSAVTKGKRPAPGGAVAARIAEYERRMTLEMESPTSPISPRTPVGLPRSFAGAIGEDKEVPRRKNTSVKYGLVQRPELFVANPDRHTKDGTSDS
ncbi:hypothetical protein M0805_007865 [Coniferiporia weirii]|nr:hypothetical protein M0805_007865 [Coniferiporia weirii]